MTYVDTSVLVAYYCPEAGSAAAQRTVLNAIEPAISSLTEAEFTSALAGKVRARELGSTTAARIRSEFRSDVARGIFQRASVAPAHLERAEAWLSTWKVRLRTLDALHLGIAAAFGAAVLTADRDQAAAARQLGLLLAPTA